jgi:hypothetical protein
MTTRMRRRNNHFRGFVTTASQKPRRTGICWWRDVFRECRLRSSRRVMKVKPVGSKCGRWPRRARFARCNSINHAYPMHAPPLHVDLPPSVTAQPSTALTSLRIPGHGDGRYPLAWMIPAPVADAAGSPGACSFGLGQ